MIAFLVACAAPPPAPPPDLDAVVVGDATTPLPMVVALHGRGDTAEHFSAALSGLTGVRVVALRAPIPWHDGASWLDGSVREMDADTLAKVVTAQASAVAARIEAARAAYPTVGEPVVTGFSQGAMLSWTLPVTHPEVVRLAVPVAGFLPTGVVPEAATEAMRATPIRALHGDADDVLPLEWAEAGRAAAAAAGMDVTLEVFPGVAHGISDPERARWHALVVAP